MRDPSTARHPKDALSRRAGTRLALAVRLVDAVTGERPPVTPPIRTDLLGKPQATNQHGFHLFLDRPDADPPEEDLPAEDVTLTVGPHPFYHPEEVTVRVSSDPPAAGEDVRIVSPSFPAIELTLLPTTAYPVKPGQTVVRGQVYRLSPDPDGERIPVEDATLSFDGLASVDGTDYTTRSTSTGEYVLCIPESETVTVSVVQGVPRVLVGGANLAITVDHPTLVAANDPDRQPVTAGRTTRWDVLLEDAS